MPKAFANGIHISYKAEEQGNPLVLIMGFAGTLRDWTSSITNPGNHRN